MGHRLSFNRVVWSRQMASIHLGRTSRNIKDKITATTDAWRQLKLSVVIDLEFL
jgi:hypothetical protein